MTFSKEWMLREARRRRGDSLVLETLFSQANGYMGLRGAEEEGPGPGEESEPYFVVQGVFDQQPGRYETDDLVNLPDWLPIRLSVDGERLDGDGARLLYRRRWLDLRDGILRRRKEVALPGGARVSLLFERLLSLADHHVAAWKLTVRALRGEVKVRLRWGFDGDRTNHGVVHFETTGKGPWSGDGLYYTLRTLQSHVDVAQAQAARLCLAGERAALSRSRLRETAAGVYREWTFTVGAHEEASVERALAVFTSRDRGAGEPLDAARERAAEAATLGYDALATAHAAAWAAKWRHADLRVVGDATSQTSLRYSLLQLMQANKEDDDHVALGAKALSGPGYRGHFFWDTEMFMLPFFVHTNPRAARNLLIYRHRTLPAARRRARRMGFAGARYPWESTLSGREQCPRWVKTPDGGEEKIVTGDQEDHIAADVAWGAWYYHTATGDEDFWLRYGVELLVEGARFWQSRAEWDPDRGKLVLRRLMGPDENHPMVDNNAYTNYMAQWNLQTAAAVVRSRRDREWRDRLAALKLARNEAAHWAEAAQRMYLPGLPSGLIPQHDGFTEEAGQRRSIKQADVLMLFRLFPERFPADVQRVNWDYYEPLTTHESSLSAGVHALVAAQVGLADRAWEYFQRARDLDLADLQGNTADGLHAAALGGLWLAVVQGFGGFAIAEDGTVQLQPRLPERWRGLRFRLQLGGGLLECSLGHDESELWYDHPAGRTLAVSVAGASRVLEPGEHRTFRSG